MLDHSDGTTTTAAAACNIVKNIGRATVGSWEVQIKSCACLLFLSMRCFGIDIRACVDLYVWQSLCSGQCVYWALSSVNLRLA